MKTSYKELLLLAALLAGFGLFSDFTQASQVFAWGRNDYGQLNVPANLTNAAAISAGFEHCLVLKSDGSVVAWGQNGNGQLNLPDSIFNNVTAISAGRYHNLALLDNGSLVAWGAGLTNLATGNDYGQCIIPPEVTNILAFSAGGHFSMALLADGTVKAWGRNTSGQTNVPAGLSNVVAIAAGGFHGLVLKADGTLAGWGGGNGSPGSIPAGLSNIVAIAATANNSYAIKSDGSLAVWGDNFGKQLNIPTDVSNIVMASGGAFYSVITSETGVPRTWGDYDSTLPAGLTSPTVAVAGGFYMGLALTNDGSPVITAQPANRRIFQGLDTAFRALVVAGSPLSYQWSFNGMPIADATNALLSLPAVQTNQAGVYGYVASSSAGVVVSSNATLTVVQQPPILTTQPASLVTYRYGPATFNSAAVGSLPLTFQWQLNGTNLSGATNASLSLAKVSPFQSGNYSVIVSNEFGTADSTNAYLTILAVVDGGNSTYNNSHYSVPVSLTNAVAIAAGAFHSMALKPDNTLVVWGNNQFGQTNIPVAATNIMAIAAGGGTCAIIRSNGTVLMWGDGYAFDGTQNKTNVPASATNIIAMVVGDNHCLALRKNGTVVGWGNNAFGQTNIPASATNIVAVAAGAYHSLLLRSNGTLLAWGNNQYNQTNISSQFPNVIAISAASYHNFILFSNGNVFAWGDAGADFQNINGVRLGTGNYSGSFYFASLQANGTVNGGYVSATSNVTAIACGGAHNLVLIGDGSPYLYWPPNALPASHPGDNVSTRVSVSGTGPIYYQWQLNGTNVSGATNATLTLANIPITSAGVYRCIISNALGTIISPDTTLAMTRWPLLFSSTNGATQMTANGFKLRVTGLAGQGPLVVYASTNLLDWLPIQTNPPAVGDLDVVDSNATNQPQMFYKAAEE